MSSRKLQEANEDIQIEGQEPLFPTDLKYLLTFNDPDEMSSLAAEWGVEYCQASPGDFEGNIHAVQTGSFQIIRESWSPGIFIQGSIPQKTTVFSMCKNKTEPPVWQHAPLDSNELAMLSESDEIDFYSKSPQELLFLSIDIELLNRYSVALLGKEFEYIQSSSCRFKINDESTSREFLHYWDYIINLSLSPNIDLQDAGYLKKIEDDILSSIIYSIVTTDNSSNRAERQLAARLAKEFMIENKKKQIAILDICEAVGTTERTLHLGFKELYGISPKAFMKNLRLNYVRKELMQAEPGSTVIDVAYKWNFYHLSRFAKSYYQMFNEYPSETLKSR